MSYVFLFGAGASFGSEHSVCVPPLGEQLLDELAAFAPQTWGALPALWLTRFRADFESAMIEFINAGHFAAPLQWDMAEFFYRLFRATPESAYAELLKGLGERVPECLFATLNYESMLFQACHHAGINIKNLSVCLPHGS